jgi:hypothetical protein
MLSAIKTTFVLRLCSTDKDGWCGHREELLELGLLLNLEAGSWAKGLRLAVLLLELTVKSEQLCGDKLLSWARGFDPDHEGH